MSTNQENNKMNTPIDMNDIKIETSGAFKITVQELEALMGFYKERGSDFRDLKEIQKLGGVEGILQKLNTSSKPGISSKDNRENDF